MFQHLFARTVADPAVNGTVGCQRCLSNQAFIITITRFDVVLDGVVVEPFCQRDIHLKMFKQDEAQLFVRRAAHRMMQTRF